MSLNKQDKSRLPKKNRPYTRKLGSARPRVKSQIPSSYEGLLKELSDAITPMLYYPQTDQQQKAICQQCGHCFYLDKDTKRLNYINSRGTIIPIPSNLLTSKHLHQIKAHGNEFQLSYEKPRGRVSKPLLVKKTTTQVYGTGFHVSKEIMRVLVAKKDLPEDPIIGQAEEALNQITSYDSNYKKMLSLFPGDRSSLQYRKIGLIQIKALLYNQLTCEFQQVSKKPQQEEFTGRGDDVYVFFSDPSHSQRPALWHVDRSAVEPVLTEWPLNANGADNLRCFFRGATSDSRLDPTETKSEWTQLGQSALTTLSRSGRFSLTLSSESAKKMTTMLLSEAKLHPYFMEDWSYNEASNKLIKAIENKAHRMPGDQRVHDLCRKIHRHLEVIGQDYYRAFPASRGLVPQVERQRILQMLTNVLKDKHSTESRHFLRTKHRVYHGTYSLHELDKYEASSFVWSDDKTLYYIDEHKTPIVIPMTRGILDQLRKVEAGARGGSLALSAKQVYQLMSRPSFSYFIWENVSYYTPWKADRNKDYFHTGTAQEMLYEIHDMKLSSRAACYQLGKLVLFVVIPTVLAAFGLWIPMAWLALKGAYLLAFQWVMVAWNIEFTYNCLRTMGLMMLHPELQQLDAELQELDHELFHTDLDVSETPDFTDSEEIDWADECAHLKSQ